MRDPKFASDLTESTIAIYCSIKFRVMCHTRLCNVPILCSPNEDLEGRTKDAIRIFEALFRGVSTRFGLRTIETYIENRDFIFCQPPHPSPPHPSPPGFGLSIENSLVKECYAGFGVSIKTTL